VADRDRLLRFIRYAKCTSGRYEARIYGVSIGLDDLQTETLENIAQEIRHDFWISRRINRQNRAIYARTVATGTGVRASLVLVEGEGAGVA
jgi:hypothetical protein